MKDFTTTSFGLVIAYLLPGLVALLSLSAWSEQLHNMFGLAFTAHSDAGLLLLMGGFALVIGLVLNVFRWLTFERAICKKYRIGPEVFSSFRDEHKLQAFLMVIEETFRYHQFFGSLAILTPFLSLSWLRSLDPGSLDTHLMVLTTFFILVEFGLSALWYELSCNACEARWITRFEAKRWPRRTVYVAFVLIILVFGVALKLHFGQLQGKYLLLFTLTAFMLIGIAMGANAIAAQRRYAERGESLGEGGSHP